jgi:hypothetical protein
VASVTLDVAPASGLSLAEIARIPEADMPAKVGRAVDELLASNR